MEKKLRSLTCLVLAMMLCIPNLVFAAGSGSAMTGKSISSVDLKDYATLQWDIDLDKVPGERQMHNGKIRITITGVVGEQIDNYHVNSAVLPAPYYYYEPIVGQPSYFPSVINGPHAVEDPPITGFFEHSHSVAKGDTVLAPINNLAQPFIDLAEKNLCSKVTNVKLIPIVEGATMKVELIDSKYFSYYQYFYNAFKGTKPLLMTRPDYGYRHIFSFEMWDDENPVETRTFKKVENDLGMKGTFCVYAFPDEYSMQDTPIAFYVVSDAEAKTLMANSIMPWTDESLKKANGTSHAGEVLESFWSRTAAISTATGQTASSFKVTEDGKNIYMRVDGSGLGPNEVFFIDADNNSQTGYIEEKWSNTGIEYMLEGGHLFSHIDHNNVWKWTDLGATGVEVTRGKTYYEIKVAKSALIGLGSTVKVGFKDIDKDWNLLSKLPISGDLLSYTLKYFKTVTSVNPSGTAAPDTVSAKPTSSMVIVNLEEIPFEAYNIDGSNYFKLRDIAKAISDTNQLNSIGTDKAFDVSYDSAKKAINLISNSYYTEQGGELALGDGKMKQATLNTAGIYKDGALIELTAYNINGNNFFKLRDLAKALDIGVLWDAPTQTIGIETRLDYMN